MLGKTSKDWQNKKQKKLVKNVSDPSKNTMET